MTNKQRRSRKRAREHAAKKRAAAQARWDEAHGKAKKVEDKPFLEPPGGIIIIDDYVNGPMVLLGGAETFRQLSTSTVGVVDGLFDIIRKARKRSKDQGTA